MNPVLLHVLSDEFNIQVGEEELIEAVVPKEPEGAAVKEPNGSAVLNGYAAVIESLRHRFTKVPGFATDFNAAIGNFSFAKLALVNDLESAGELLSSNDVVATIAGDSQARGRLGRLRLKSTRGA